eukprot:515470-Pleurochrysis_carterae.AAC.1
MVKGHASGLFDCANWPRSGCCLSDCRQRAAQSMQRRRARCLWTHGQSHGRPCRSRQLVSSNSSPHLGQCNQC